MLWIGFIVWWALGIGSILWLMRGNDLTWGQLFQPLFFGVLGPIIWIVIGIMVLSAADFWNQPIFKKKAPPIDRD